jgi:hypothetical protein
MAQGNTEKYLCLNTISVVVRGFRALTLKRGDNGADWFISFSQCYFIAAVICIFKYRAVIEIVMATLRVPSQINGEILSL